MRNNTTEAIMTRHNKEINGKRFKTLSRHTCAFTILEVVVAVAILALAFITAMEIAASSSQRSAKALQKWKIQHMLTQATEYYLLTGPKSSIPREYFPYEEYRAECVELLPDIPNDVEPERGPWRIAKLKIAIYDKHNKEIASIAIHKILRRSQFNK